jgi:hypothetical protein
LGWSELALFPRICGWVPGWAARTCPCPPTPTVQQRMADGQVVDPFKLPSKDRRTEAHRGHGDLAPRFHRRQASPRSLRSNPAGGAETGSPAARTAAGWSPPTGVVPIAQHDQQRPTRDQIEGCPPSSWGTSPCCISPGRTKLSTNSTTDHADRTTERPRCRRPARRSRPPDPNAWDEDKPRSD